MHGLCVIAFIGSVFSPHYARARRHAAADPLDHCAFNITLHGGVRRWTMTERSARSVRLDGRSLRIGPSTLHWDGTAFTYQLDELGCPLPRRLRGELRVQPLSMPSKNFALDRSTRHIWSPLAPRARIEVRLHDPRLHWSGEAYLDRNTGTRPLEQDFHGWNWSRANLPDGTAVFYDLQPRHDAPHSLALHIDPHGVVRPMPQPALCSVAASRWGIARQTRSEEPGAQLLRTLVDAPFYARSLLATRLQGQTITTVHESLNLDRFRRRWVQTLLPFRVPRWSATRSAPRP